MIDKLPSLLYRNLGDGVTYILLFSFLGFLSFFLLAIGDVSVVLREKSSDKGMES